ncbi:hypothetical protein [Chitinimonas sp. BJYL2]|uniref:hypothetical protein n=1 Tax=Chitinimonas sp. BJYL2 TaxID=2976696 RepID=UPI0022B2D783|nr:hypothetical protein [Chitinimonas sp. BJYL2]
MRCVAGGWGLPPNGEVRDHAHIVLLIHREYALSRLSLAPLLAMLVAMPAMISAHAATPEEARLARARDAMPAVVGAFDTRINALAQSWTAARDAREAMEQVREHGQQLWADAKRRLRAQQDADDRPLYWARLAMAQTLREQKPAFPVFAADREAIIAAFEQASRGMDEISYPARSAMRRILITGFDPFLLDRRLNQSNPSGVTALLLDGEEIDIDGQRARIEAAIFPVRYADFDAGMVETFLMPWLAGPQAVPENWLEAARLHAQGGVVAGQAKPQIDLLATISMGRKDFDLERYPGRRRSADVVDNLNALPGASRLSPKPPLLNGKPISGPEFVEFSLPVAAMQRAQGPYAIHDNRWVRVVPDTRFAAGGLATLKGKTAVEGGGGGYLSNEIAYRSARLRDALGIQLPLGHIHTPAIAAYEPDKTTAIAAQIREMLRQAIPTLAAR